MIAVLCFIAFLLAALCGIQTWTTLSIRRESKEIRIARRAFIATVDKNVQALAKMIHDAVEENGRNASATSKACSEQVGSIVVALVKLSEQIKSIQPDKLPETAATIADGIKRLAAYSVGSEKIAVANIEAITRLESAVNEFTKMSFGIESRNGKAKTFQDLSDDVEVERMMREDGLTRQEAAEQVRQNRNYSFGA